MKILLLTLLITISQQVYTQNELFNNVKYNDTINVPGLNYFKCKDSLKINNVFLRKYYIELVNSDTLIGFWGISNDTIYYISEKNLNKDCIELTPMFYVQNNRNVFLYNYYTGCRQGKTFSFSFTTYLIGCNQVEAELIYTFEQNLFNETLPITGIEAMKNVRNFTFSLQNGFNSFSEFKNCVFCEFPY